jgi:hypothetical protein
MHTIVHSAHDNFLVFGICIVLFFLFVAGSATHAAITISRDEDDELELEEIATQDPVPRP